MIEIKITELNENQRADKFIRKYLNNAPLSFIYKKFREKDIKINNKWIKQDYILKNGDILKIYISDEQLNEFNNPSKIINFKNDLDIVYEDENILILNKPKGILIHGDNNEKRITLANKVISYLYNKKEYLNDGKSFVPSPVHRLDRNTSGIVLFAKNLKSSHYFMNLFKEKTKIEKYYLLLIKGKVEKEGIINAPLFKNSETGLVRVDFKNPLSKEAITKYKVISNNNEYSLIEANLITGRTHQLRVHFSYINHPIIGDAKYGDFELNKKFYKEFNYTNQFLCAYKLKFNDLDDDFKYLSNKVFKINLPKIENEIIKKINLKY